MIKLQIPLFKTLHVAFVITVDNCLTKKWPYFESKNKWAQEFTRTNHQKPKFVWVTKIKNSIILVSTEKIKEQMVS